MARTDRSARVATTERYALAEGINWDDATGDLAWIDLHPGLVLRGEDSGGVFRELSRTRVDSTVGAVAFAADGGLLVAARRGLAVIAPDGTVSLGPDLIPGIPAGRLNDGAVDPQGRYLVGSATQDTDTGHEVLLRVSPDGTVETLRTGLSLSNGIGWSPDGGTIYHVDTWAKTVSSHRYDGSAEWDPAGWVTVIDDFPGYPDGLTVDASGDLWVAVWDGGVVQRFAASGALVESVTVGTPQVSCPALIGECVLAITTSSDDTAGDPLAGALFRCDVDAAAQPTSRWAGSTTNPYWRTA
ncbi:SMP-30/gluconolactonase/LRE family protein [soil metagenome]